MEDNTPYEDKLLTVYGKSEGIRKHIITFLIISVATLITGWMLLYLRSEGDGNFLLLMGYYAVCFMVVLVRSPQHISIYTKFGNDDLNIRGNFNEGWAHREGPESDFDFRIDDQNLKINLKDQKLLTLDKSKFSNKSIELISNAIEKAPRTTPEEFNKWLGGQGIPSRVTKKSETSPGLDPDEYVTSYYFAETSSYLIWERVYFGVCGSVLGLSVLIAGISQG